MKYYANWKLNKTQNEMKKYFKEFNSFAIADTEEHLQAARRLYNAAVSSYNQRIVSFPSSVVASSKGMKKRDFFQTSEENKQDVAMNFN